MMGGMRPATLLLGAQQQWIGDPQTEGLRRGAVNHQVEPRGLRKWQICRCGALEVTR